MKIDAGTEEVLNVVAEHGDRTGLGIPYWKLFRKVGTSGPDLAEQLLTEGYLRDAGEVCELSRKGQAYLSAARTPAAQRQ